MDYPKHRVAIPKAIIGITEPARNVDYVKYQTRRNKFKNTSLTFLESDTQGLPSHHNQLMYILACIRDVEFRRTSRDTGSSLNIIPYPSLRPREYLEPKS